MLIPFNGMSTERKLFKDYFDREAAEKLAEQVSRVWSKFDQKRFVILACQDLNSLEFHPRIRQFSDALRTTLPSSIPQALKILAKSLPPALPDTEMINDGWLQWPLGQFIADHGSNHFEESLACMLELTQRFTAEFAVRPLIEAYPDKTIDRLLAWTNHPNPHVRRWCSEGIRPRLPWGRRLTALIDNPKPIFPILEDLKDDPSEYVRRSVANNLNDIAKDHPEAVIRICRKWLKNASLERKRLIERALRSLVKDGNAQALGLLGFGQTENLTAQLTIQPDRVSIGQKVTCQATIKNEGTQPLELMVDYAVHYVRQREKTGRKVFKWTRLHLKPGEEISLAKQHPFVRTSVRALYPGEHVVELQVNGKVLVRSQCLLTSSEN